MQISFAPSNCCIPHFAQNVRIAPSAFPCQQIHMHSVQCTMCGHLNHVLSSFLVFGVLLNNTQQKLWQFLKAQFANNYHTAVDLLHSALFAVINLI